MTASSDSPPVSGCTSVANASNRVEVELFATTAPPCLFPSELVDHAGVTEWVNASPAHLRP